MQRARFTLEEKVGGLVARKDAARRGRRRRAIDPTQAWATEVMAVAERIKAAARTTRRVA